MDLITLKKHIRIEQSPVKIILVDDCNGEFYECNETAYSLLKKLFNGASRETLVKVLLTAYEITEPDAQLQVNNYLSLLTNLGMLDGQA